MIHGYARISTEAQDIGPQVKALRAAGAVNVFKDIASGARADRKGLRKAVAALEAGDVLMVTRLDRLARSTLDLLHTLHQITARKAGFRSLADAWADTTTAQGRLMVTIIGGLAEFERELILSRTSEGRARAVARGVKLGPKFKLTLEQRRQAIARLEKGEQGAAVAVTFNVSPSTISRLRA